MITNHTIAMKITIASRTKPMFARFSLQSDTKYVTALGRPETIPAKSIIEIPLPIPFSLIRSPSQMIIDAPATKQATITIAERTTANMSGFASRTSPYLRIAV